MSLLRPGTPCFHVGLVERPEYNGRIVVVVGPVVNLDDPGEWYEIEADWLARIYPRHEVQALRRNLLPIIPPAPATHDCTGHALRSVTGRS